MEKKKKPQEKPSISPGFGGFDFDDGANNPLTVNVGSGGYNENLPVAGKSVAEIRKKFKTRMEIDDGSVAVINGQDLEDSEEDVFLCAGQKLQFIHKAGEKGRESDE